MLLATVFFTGCEINEPEFSVEEGKAICAKIMDKNAEILSPGSPYSYKLTFISFKDKKGNERRYTVKYDSKSGGQMYVCTQNVVVGKDDGGWYVHIKEEGDLIKLR